MDLPTKVVILRPDEGAKTYSDGRIKLQEYYITITQEDKILKYPLHRVHKMVFSR
jgi:hypothetical protein